MDTKALAKSKRAHSLHHSKKHHPNPKAKAQAASASISNGGKKPTGKLEQQKPSQSHVPRELPSNWDRYEDTGSGSEDSSPQVSSGQAYEVAPKSKGADYAHLIAEAKARPQSSFASESFSLLKSPLDEFDFGQGQLLSVKGERMLSWASEYNFLLDDKGTGGEASFLSLNLDLLAKQLEKADIAERLFIEPDILSPELLSDFQEISEKVPDECSTASASKKIESTSDIFTINQRTVGNKNIQPHDENVLSEPSENRFSPIAASSSKGPGHTVEVCLRSNETSLDISEETTSDAFVDTATRDTSRFEVATAEAELDLLLDSFSETKIFDSSRFDVNSVTKQSRHAFEMPGGSSVRPQSSPMQHIKKGELPNHSSTMAALDEDIDDLLNETSNLMKVNKTSTLHELKPSAHDDVSASNLDSKSKMLDDFSSWLDTI